MAKIKKLSAHLADLIAAGEVVERPGSVIKELVENSIDAGADAVTVEIKNGGMTYIRVTDNGCGMSPEDAEIAFLRHATSKLKSEEELEAIHTLGFRGEALAATSAVSRIELITREQNSPQGFRIVLEGGTVMEKGSWGCPEGTTIIVRDLFFNTPARLKFMKTDRAEGTFVTGIAQRIALSRLDVSIKYIKDNKEEFHTPGDSRPESCIYSLMGRNFAKSLINAATDDGAVKVHGFVSAPSDARGSRNNQFFFVNGRSIKSKLLQTALEKAYQNNLFQGRFPSCVIYIEMKPSLVDVNVHPAKTEVKFQNDRQVFDGVYYAVLSALSGAGEAPSVELLKSTEAVIKSEQIREQKPEIRSNPVFKHEPKLGGFSNPSPSYPKTSYSGGFGKASVAPKGDSFYKTVQAKPNAGFFNTIDDSQYQQTVFNDFAKSPTGYGTSFDTLEKSVEKPIEQPKPIEFVTESELPKPYIYIGEALNTYIIIQQGEELILIDKHAAHERMIFDRLQAGESHVMSQPLIEPYICNMSSTDAEIIMDGLDMLTPLGYEIDSFGDDSIAVRAVPSDTDAGDLTAHMEELAKIIAASGKVGLQAARDEILHTVACKAAIKAGKPSQKEELMALADKVMAGEIKYCPHGRPVAVNLTKAELDKKFKRI